MRSITRIIVHHSASPLDTTAADIARWHAARFKLGTGYHRIIEADGTTKDGRKLQRQGAHAKGNNGDSIGVCVVGNNCNPDHYWTSAQDYALYELIWYFYKMWHDIRVVGHRDVLGAATLCPGINMRDWCSDRGLGFLI